MTRLWAAAVLGLSLGSGPADIPRLVMPVSIDAIECVAFRPRADIGQELLEARSPRRADANAAATVVLPAWRGGEFAAADHAAPGSVFRRVPRGTAATAAGVSMPHMAGQTPAAARLHDAGAQRVDVAQQLPAAVAAAPHPTLAIGILVSIVDHDEATEPRSWRRHRQCRMQRTLNLATQAAAGLRQPARKALDGHATRGAAVASALDIRPISAADDRANGRPPAERGAEVDRFCRHWTQRTTLRIDGSMS